MKNDKAPRADARGIFSSFGRAKSAEAEDGHSSPPKAGSSAKEDKAKKDFINRLSYVEGHCRAVRRMVDRGVYCIDIIHQIEAVEAGLKKVKEKILESHLNTCVTTAIKGKNEKQREKVLGELMEVFKKNNHD